MLILILQHSMVKKKHMVETASSFAQPDRKKKADKKSDENGDAKPGPKCWGCGDPDTPLFECRKPACINKWKAKQSNPESKYFVGNKGKHKYYLEILKKGIPKTSESPKFVQN